jgi:hypothetical protein
MQKYLGATIIFLIFIAVDYSNLYAQDIPNAGFEKWVTKDGYQEPENWMSADTYLALMPDNTVFTLSSTDTAFLDNKAALLESKSFVFLPKPIPGVLTNGTFQLDLNNSPEFTGGTPFSARPAGIQFHYRYRPVKGDMFAARVYLFRFNPDKGKRDTIGVGAITDGGLTTVYQPMIIPIDYYRPEVPDSILILFVSSAFKPVAGTRLFVDDVTVLETVDVPDGKMDESSVLFYPNPASGRLNIQLDKNWRGARYSIYDESGRTVLPEREIPAEEFWMDVANLKPGIYTLCLVNNGNVLSRQVVIARK